MDLDPRWVKRLIATQQFDQARAYMDHVVEQALTILKHRKVSALFTTPKLQKHGGAAGLSPGGYKGVFCGGTTMDRQYARFLEEKFVRMAKSGLCQLWQYFDGASSHRPFSPENDYSIAYYAPQPRAVLRVIDSTTGQPVEYDWGGWSLLP